MPNPVEGLEIATVQVSRVFFFTQGRAGFEEVYHGQNYGIQGLIGHTICPIVWLGVYAWF
jgi:hypothetical protein